MGITVRPSRSQGRLFALVTYDLSPEFSARARRFAYHPLGILLLAGLASLLCGLFLHAQGFVLAGGVLTVVTLGVIWPGMTLQGLVGTLSFERPRAIEGESIEVQLKLGNRLPWPAWGLAVKGGFGELPGELVAGVAVVPRRRTILCRWSFVPEKRGVYPHTAPRLTTGFPFGLWENRRALACESSLVVWPRTYPVGPVPPTGGTHQVEGAVSRGKVGTYGDVVGVRPYRRGDSPRRIHWAQSARQDRLIVCELQANSRPVIQLILDVDPAVHIGTGADSSREWAIRVVASFARGWLGDGAQVGLTWGHQSIAAASGPAQVRAILDALAEFDAAAQVPLIEVLAGPQDPSSRDGLRVIVTTDLARVPTSRRGPSDESQRLVILKSEGFGAPLSDELRPAMPPAWLVIDSPMTVPIALQGGWREAWHGS